MDFNTIKREVKALEAFITELNVNTKTAMACYHGNFSNQDFSIYTKDTKFSVNDDTPTKFKMKEIHGIKFKIYADVAPAVAKKLIKTIVERA